MTARTYSPRRASARWLEGAPPYVLDVWDNGGRTQDRFTVYLFGDGWGVRGNGPADTAIEFLAMDETPTLPLGFSQFGEVTAADRAAYAYARPGGDRRIRWLDLPENIRAHVRARCEPRFRALPESAFRAGGYDIESLNRGVA